MPCRHDGRRLRFAGRADNTTGRLLLEGYDCVFGSRFPVSGGQVVDYPRVKLLVNGSRKIHVPSALRFR